MSTNLFQIKYWTYSLDEPLSFISNAIGADASVAFDDQMIGVGVHRCKRIQIGFAFHDGLHGQMMDLVLIDEVSSFMRMASNVRQDKALVRPQNIQHFLVVPQQSEFITGLRMDRDMTLEQRTALSLESDSLAKPETSYLPTTMTFSFRSLAASNCVCSQVSCREVNPPFNWRNRCWWPSKPVGSFKFSFGLFFFKRFNAWM